MLDIASRFTDAPVFFEDQAVDPRRELVAVYNLASSSRIVFSVDRSTGLPVSGEKQFKSVRGWETSGRFEAEFNQPIRAEKFEPSDLVPHP